jgi:hypothetical protein
VAEARGTCVRRSADSRLSDGTRARGARRRATSRPLHYPAFRHALIGRAVSAAGSWMQTVAAGWLIFDLTRSAAAVGVLTFLSRGPGMLLSAYGGELADRYDRRRLVIVCYVCTPSRPRCSPSCGGRHLEGHGGLGGHLPDRRRRRAGEPGNAAASGRDRPGGARQAGDRARFGLLQYRAAGSDQEGEANARPDSGSRTPCPTPSRNSW